MKTIDDEKLKFYLRNERQIDEWSAIATRVPDEVDRFLLSCANSVQGLAVSLGAEFVAFLDGAWPKLLIVRPEWRIGRTDLRMGIGVQWHRGLVSFSKGERPIVGVWAHIDAPGGSSLSNAMKTIFSRSNLLNSYSSNQWWPAWRYETAPNGFWDDLEPFRTQLLGAVRTTWTRFHECAEAAISSNNTVS